MPRHSAKKSRQRALNAFDTAVDEEEYQVGLRQQEDIDPEFVADERIRQLVSGDVRPEDDEEIDSDEAFGSDSDISINLHEASESEWGDSLDEEELVPLSEIWDQDAKKKDENPAQGNSQPTDTMPRRLPSEDSQDSSEGSEDEDDDSEEVDDSEDVNDSEVESEIEGDSEEENKDALRKAVKSIASRGDINRRLAVHAGEENPFALPASAEKVSIEELSGEAKKPKPIGAPLPQRLQDREDRAAAFDVASGEVSKWEDSVKQLRRAEHLQFPINAPSTMEEPALLDPNDSKNSLESKVDSILKQSQLQDEKGLSAFEQAAPSKLSYEELKMRRQELRYARELMFREEMRAKRIKKIKSKSWRKVHKRERLKQQEAVEALDSDEEDDGTRRAVERATLKHQSTKWGKERGAFGGESRQAMEEMLQQGDNLRQRVAGNYGSDSDDTELALRDGQQEISQENPQEPPQKGLLGMKFMVEAADRERKANEQLLRDDFDESEQQENVGRRSFTPAGFKAAAAEKSDVSEDELETSDRVVKRASAPASEEGTPSDKKKEKNEPEQEEPEKLDGADNPWLSLSSAKGKSKYKAQPQKSVQEKPSVQIDISNTLGDSMVREPQLSLKQQELVKRAFAGDEVTEEFEREKSQKVEDEGDKEIDETLPGWGSWSGPGMSSPKKRKVRHVKGVDERKRRDFGLDGVIYNEKVNKKNARYQASGVPFPFENREQYERSLRMSIGQEWSSKSTFQRATRPRIVVKRGEVIDPLEKPL